MAPAAAIEGDGRYVITDWRTGLALHGIDPVAYFADGEALSGRPDMELTRSEVVWRFRNEANREAFAAAPDVYAPRFAGYDPIAIGRGVATPGNPQIFLVHGGRLYLFYTPEAREAFRKTAPEAIIAGDARWPALRAGLSVTGAIAAVSDRSEAVPLPPDPHRQ